MRWILCCLAAVAMGLPVVSFGAVSHDLPDITAGSITMQFNGWEVSWPSSQSDGTGTYVLLTVLADSPSKGWTVVQKAAVFTAPVTSSIDQPVSLTFRQISPNAAKRLIITQENITNASGLAWEGFEFALVGGVNGSAGLPHFDAATSFNSSTPFSVAPFTTVTQHTESGLVRRAVLSDGELPNGAIWRPGSTQGELVIQASPTPDASQQFTLLETPISVPEPAALVVLGLLSPLLMGRRRRA